MIRTCLPCVHPVLADGRAGVRRQPLEAGRVGGRRGDDGGVLQRAGVLQRLPDTGDRGALLADRHVDAADLLLRVAGLPVLLLVDDGVDADRGLAGLAVTDDQLALAAADRRHGVDGLDAGLQRLADALPLRPPRRPAAPAARCSSEAISPRPSIGCAERVDHPAQEGVADRHREHLAGAGDLLALLDGVRVTQDDRADRRARPGSARRRARRPGTGSSSLAIAEGRPSTVAMPSPVSATMPTSSRVTSGE